MRQRWRFWSFIFLQVKLTNIYYQTVLKGQAFAVLEMAASAWNDWTTWNIPALGHLWFRTINHMWYLQICQRWRIWIVRKPQNRSALSGLEPRIRNDSAVVFPSRTKKVCRVRWENAKTFSLIEHHWHQTVNSYRLDNLKRQALAVLKTTTLSFLLSRHWFLKTVNVVRFKCWLLATKSAGACAFAGVRSAQRWAFWRKYVVFTDEKRTALSALVMALAILSLKCESDFAF